MAKLDGTWLPAVLAADAHLEIRTHASTVLHRHPHQLPDASRVEHAERVVR